MNHNKALGGGLWLVGLVLAHLIVFLLPQEITVSVWITYGFILFAFLSQLILWLVVWQKSLTPEQQFLRTPLMFYSVCYLMGQIILGLIFAMVSASAKIAVLVNVLLLLIMCSLFIFSLIGRNHIERVDQSQKVTILNCKRSAENETVNL